MPRPSPTWVYHFTHVDHLASIVRDGLVCDSDAHVQGRLTTEVGAQTIKQRRQHVPVPCGRRGVVADYVPFYFGRRGPMLFNIHTGRVPTYREGQGPLMYLCSTVEVIDGLGLAWAASDRNAATALASFTSDLVQLDEHIDWALVESRSWARTDEAPDRPQRHQAEFLVHSRLPWAAITFVATRDKIVLDRVEAVLSTLIEPQPRRGVRPGWYF